MWWHHSARHAGNANVPVGAVATAARATGPFAFEQLVTMPDKMFFRDCTLFQERDGAASLVFSTDRNANLAIVRLRDDYLRPQANKLVVRVFANRYMEAPCVFRNALNDQYYFIGSDSTSWRPNEARSAAAPALRGPWRELGTPCVGEFARRPDITFGGQSTFVFEVPGRPGCFVLMLDRWAPDAMENSRYVWLPIFWTKSGGAIDRAIDRSGDRSFVCFVVHSRASSRARADAYGGLWRPHVQWLDEWDFSVFDREPYKPLNATTTATDAAFV